MNYYATVMDAERVVAVGTATGTILRFDEAKGYGFIASDAGGEDIFLHANALVEAKALYRAGTAVGFDVVKDARGLKATSVRVLAHGGAPDRVQPNSEASAPRGSDADGALDEDGLCDVLPAYTLRREVINLCLESVPSMTGEQMNLLSTALITLARQHGWVEG